MLLILAHDSVFPTASNVSKQESTTCIVTVPSIIMAVRPPNRNIISFMASDLVEKDYESTGSTSLGYKNHADDNLVFPTTNEDAGVTEAV
ncbi:hypothetical protein Syun_030587 [Stephania yunnanensis]|uniref:Uncharacterized protein n=1 Tax=Stephania yunnanensis TaxID=152371 RepID=A0AAP0HC10_9MAGN